MSIVDRIKKKLPIVGSSAPPESAPAPGWVREGAPPKDEARGPDVSAWIDELVKGNKLVVFMKGSPQAPMCGFSANAAAILMNYAVPIKHVDILQDPAVRQGVKDYSQWPTLPQIFINGEFIGGSDILAELHQSGELGKLLGGGAG